MLFKFFFVYLIVGTVFTFIVISILQLLEYLRYKNNPYINHYYDSNEYEKINKDCIKLPSPIPLGKKD